MRSYLNIATVIRLALAGSSLGDATPAAGQIDTFIAPGHFPVSVKGIGAAVLYANANQDSFAQIVVLRLSRISRGEHNM